MASLSYLQTFQNFLFGQPEEDELTPLLPGQYLPTEKINLRVKDLAKLHRETLLQFTLDEKQLIKRFDKNKNYILRAYKVLDQSTKKQLSTITAAEKWIVDNQRLILQTISQIHSSLTTEFFSRLPVLPSDYTKTRIYETIAQLILYSDSRISLKRLTGFIEAYQQITNLTIAELWAIPIIIQTILLENFRRIMKKTTTDMAMRNQAQQWITKLNPPKPLGSHSFNAIVESLAKMQRLLTPSFLMYIIDGFEDKERESQLLSRLSLKLPNETLRSLRKKISLERAEQKANEKTIRNTIITLQNMRSVNWNNFVEKVSVVEKILRKDPAHIYSKMDFKTRDTYRHTIEQIYYRTGANQEEIARWVIKKSNKKTGQQDLRLHKNHVGYYLIGEGRKQLEGKFTYQPRYAESLLRLSQYYTLLIYSLTIIIFAVIFMALPILTILKSQQISNRFTILSLIFSLLFPTIYAGAAIANFLLVRVFPPKTLPKMDSSLPVPVKSRTMVVLPTLLTPDPNETDELIANLEKNYLANRDSNIFFALLLALPESKKRNDKPSKRQKGLLDEAVVKVTELNRKYPREYDVFSLFFRKREWDPSEKRLIEWERKRGKLVEFNQLLRGNKNTSYILQTTTPNFLPTIKYVVTIDRDTFLPRGCVKQLIATISHPIHKAIVDKKINKVTRGYGIIQPRLGNSFQENQSLLHELLAEHSGWDSYSGVASSIYQDLFHEGFYMGKGIYDVDIFNETLTNRIPQNTLLSHDHIEGFYCRTGYASDIQIFEDSPQTYHSYVSRLHRWIRGDWQRLGWIFNYVRDASQARTNNPLELHHRWKLLEDAISNLTPPSVFLILLTGWLLLPTHALLMTFYGLAILNIHPIIGFIDSLFLNWSPRAWHFNLSRFLKRTRLTLLRIIFNIVFLLSQTFTILDAITKALVRTLITKQHRLEWLPSHQVRDDESVNKAFFNSLYTTLACLAMGLFIHEWVLESILPASPLLLSWSVAPFAAYFISQAQEEKTPGISKNQLGVLRLIARKTWRFFEELVTPETHWLPPDHFQENTEPQVANKTSITNIGVYLMSALAALDLGYISLQSLVSRTDKLFTSLLKFKRHRGHFFNWYDTSTLEALPPLYISTVDSGNLAASLITIKNGLLDLIDNPIINPQILEGLNDILVLLIKEGLNLPKQTTKHPELTQSWSSELLSLRKDIIQIEPQTLSEWLKHLQLFEKRSQELQNHPVFSIEENDFSSLEESRFWTEALNITIERHINQLLSFAPWLITTTTPNSNSSKQLQHLTQSLDEAETLRDLIERYQEISAILGEIKEKKTRDLADFKRKIKNGQAQLTRLLNKCKQIAAAADSLFEEMDFSFLYNKKRDVFRVGYNLTKHRFDKFHYDLLASEARLASLIAIAKEDVPLKHWTSLGRPLTAFQGNICLLSWGGSMYEYCFPLLVTPNIPNSLMAETYNNVLKAQMRYAAKHRIPWGMSESSYATINKYGHYRYKLHGIPFLGLKQRQFKYLVVAPYASFLTLAINPRASYKNILHLHREEAEGKFGFYESIDYTQYKASRIRKKIVRTFLCHHQAINLISIANLVSDNQMKERFVKDKKTSATLFVLEEIVPNKFKLVSSPKPLDEQPHKPTQKKHGPLPIYSVQQHHQAPLMHVLSNGKYRVYISNRGSGFSEYLSTALTRWEKDATFDSSGFFHYIKDHSSENVWSAGYQPVKTEPAKYCVSFSEQSARIARLDNDVETTTDIRVFPNTNIELRSITLTNLSNQLKPLEITSYAEMVLLNRQEDISHPNFSKMRLRSSYLADHNMLIFSREHSSTSETYHAFHKAITSKPPSQPLQYETNRLNFLGRGNTVSNPEVITSNKPLTNASGYTLDPIASLRHLFELQPEESVTLHYLTIATKSYEEGLALSSEYQNHRHILNSIQSEDFSVNTQPLSTQELALCQKFLTCLIYKRSLKRIDLSDKTTWGKKTSWQDTLGKFDIASNLPIVTIEISAKYQENFLRQLLKIAQHLLYKGVSFNFIILVKSEDGYFQPEYLDTQEIIDRFRSANVSSEPTHQELKVNLYLAKNFSNEETLTLTQISQLCLNPSNGPLTKQINHYFQKI